jgi:thioester reductase-like protein
MRAALLATETGEAVIEAVKRGQVVVVAGDVSKRLFGLSPAKWNALTEVVSSVVHCACQVTGTLGYKLLRPNNVDATLHCLELVAASAAADARFVYVSSMSSQGTDSLSLLGSYGASKRVSEILVERAAALGLPHCAILRPGMIGMSASGALSPNDTVTRYMQTLLELKCCPNVPADTRISLCSVEDVSAAVVRLLADSESSCRHVNVAGPGFTTVGQLASCTGEPLDKLPYGEFLERVQKEACALRPLLDYFRGSFPLGREETFEHPVVVPITEELVAAAFAWIRRTLAPIERDDKVEHAKRN